MFLRKTCFRIPIIFVVMTIPVFRRRQSNKKNERPTRSRPLSHPCNLRNSWTNSARGERRRSIANPPNTSSESVAGSGVCSTRSAAVLQTPTLLLSRVCRKRLSYWLTADANGCITT